VNPRATLVLLVITLLVLGGLFYLRQTVAPTRDQAELERYAAVFDPEEITQIELTRGGEKITLRRENIEWRIESPVGDRADAEAVDRLLTAARFLEVRDGVAAKDPSALPESGLSTPRVRLDLRGKNDIRIDLGSGAALPAQIYARVAGQPRVLRVPDTIVELATAPVEKLRDPRLTNLVSDDIEKFTVRRADGEMTVRRERGRWIIEKPVRAPADLQAVRAFLEPLLGLRITAFQASPAGTDAPGSLAGQTAAISMTQRGGGENLDLEISRGSDTTAANVTARFAPRGGALTVDAAGLSLFDVSPESLRDRSLGYVDADTVDRIVIETGGDKLVLQRAGDGWSAEEESRTFTAVQVNNLIDAFNKTRIVSFRASMPPDEAGLEAPSGRLAFYAWLSENTAEEAAGGHPIASVDFGEPEVDGNIFARGGSSGEIVTIPAALEKELEVFTGSAPPASNGGSAPPENQSNADSR
jgi:hypothetical protein